MESVLTHAEWRCLARQFQFTPRELKVAQALLDEKSPREIALDLGTTPETVSTSLEQLFRKCGAKSSVSFAVRLFATIRRLEAPPDADASPKR